MISNKALLHAYTGLYGDEDRKAREIGRVFLLAHDGQHFVCVMVSEAKDAFEVFLQNEEWADWCAVIANSVTEAMGRYEDAFAQYQEAQEMFGQEDE